MKRLLLSSFLFGVFVLSACSSGVNDVKPVEANNIKEERSMLKRIYS